MLRPWFASRSSFFDSATQQWKTIGGSYQFFVGNSSANVPVSDAVTVRATGSQ